MGFKIILKSKKKTIVSDHRKKSNAIQFKNKIIKARKEGKLPSLKSIRLIKVKKLTRK